MKLLDIPSLKFLKVGVDSDPLNNNNLEYLEKQNAIAALIVNHAGDKVLFVNQYRAGVHNYIYEVPAGLIDEGEEPIHALEREVREETGYRRQD
ncbi:MAG: NUDIX hydrolase, partial [Fusobacterium periodonticum]|nr:NUDIX hydrolase [Fusobacterium periodonticum]